MFRSPEAIPASAGFTPASPAIVTGMKQSAKPMPFSTNGPTRSRSYRAGTGSRAISASETVSRSSPAVSTRLGPKRVTSDSATFETTAIVTATAENASPV